MNLKYKPSGYSDIEMQTRAKKRYEIILNFFRIIYPADNKLATLILHSEYNISAHGIGKR